MGKIVLYGWNSGFNKVAHTKLLCAELGYSLARAKSVTDSVVDRKSVTIDVADGQVERLASELSELGVKCRVDGIDRQNQVANRSPLKGK